MVAVARECGVTLMEAMISTLNPNFRVVQEYLPRLGTIRRYFASFLPVLLAATTSSGRGSCSNAL